VLFPCANVAEAVYWSVHVLFNEPFVGMFRTKSVAGLPFRSVTWGAATPYVRFVARTASEKRCPGHDVETVIFVITACLLHLRDVAVFVTETGCAPAVPVVTLMSGFPPWTEICARSCVRSPAEQRTKKTANDLMIVKFIGLPP
jgi:hypothetical protein